MSDRLTPETDAAQHQGLLRGNTMPTQVVHVNFARKLERERDEARESLEEEKKFHHQTHAELVQTQCKLLDMQIGRDEAREALASREVVLAQQNTITDLVLENQKLKKERDEAREAAGELEDIASKYLSFLLAITPKGTNEKHQKETEKTIDALKRWSKT